VSVVDAIDDASVEDDAGPDLVESDLEPEDTPPPPPPPELTLTFKTEVGDDGFACKDQCAVYLTQFSTRTLEVVFTSDGQPLGGQLVNFAIENDEAGLGQLSALTAFTNESGVASVALTSKQLGQGFFKVKAWIDEASVPPLYFNVTVTVKAVVPLTVFVTYAGLAPITFYQTYLYAQSEEGEPACSQDLASEEVAFAQSPPTPVGGSTKFLDLQIPQNKSITYTVLVLSLDEAGSKLAWGCNDTDAVVSSETSTSVTIELIDVELSG
jgi:hypothetical protein